ncbi:hypothetical protein FH063_005569 [Azospirillum argentinense]|uniref:Uncharacterized protein n=1 Tax=Azospirillum argentinense TaxID=2970906 RepID=A0A5B0KWL1_9PROT|nr:hypothetical protein FH063_005569 [Azospirillum argentinense]
MVKVLFVCTISRIHFAKYDERGMQAIQKDISHA